MNMFTNFLLAAAEGGESTNVIVAVAKQFGVAWPQFLAQCVSFLIVAGVLYKFAYKPVQTVLEERRKKIADGLANAEKMTQELSKAQGKAEEILNAANTQAGKMLEEARAAAARVQESETQKAIAAANNIVTTTRQALEAERARMLAELRREVGRLVVNTTAKVTGKVLTPGDQQRLTEEANRHLAN
jgi:F-type H+-transporting ATPase subunit b